MTFVSHPRIVPDKVEERAYQVRMAKECLKDDTLLILPTGLGKTIIAAFVIADILEKKRKVLMLAPTKPLVEQHYETLCDLLVDTKIGTMNGNMLPEKRATVIEENDVIVCTPQVVDNDLECERYNLSPFGLIVFDEAHRAVGNYAYVNIASHYYTGLALGMTASPGADLSKMQEVCDNLHIRRADMRTEEDADVSPYIHDVKVTRTEVNMPSDLTKVVQLLNDIMVPYLNDLRNMGLLDPNWPASTKHLLMIGQTLQKRLARGEKTATVFRGLIAQSVCIKMMHAIGLAETQGMSALRSYMYKLDEDATSGKSTKAARSIASSPQYKEIWDILNTSKVEHPKISKVMSLVSQQVNDNKDNRVIVFSQYRDTCDLLVDKLSKVENARVAKLIGQSKGGLKQKEQIQLLDDFRNGTFNVLVSTSVGEEGLDVANTDLVIFYEPVPSEIRTIQRRGRTGRKDSGEVHVLIAKGTRDEVFENTSSKKEELMKEHLDRLNYRLSKGPAVPSKKQTSIVDY